MKDITFAIICDLHFLFELTIFYTIESIALESYSNFHHESANNRQLKNSYSNQTRNPNANLTKYDSAVYPN